MLWTLVYRADDWTLTDAEVDAAHARVVAALKGAPHRPAVAPADGPGRGAFQPSRFSDIEDRP